MSDAAARLFAADLDTPRDLLGPHPDPQGGVRVRVFHPDARAAELVPASGAVQPLAAESRPGLFSARVTSEAAARYRVRFTFADGTRHEQEDPYRFRPTIGDVDLYLFAEGTHRRLFEVLGARIQEQDGVRGVRFAVWAPHARRASVVGEFCDWDGRRLPMQRVSPSGVFELFVPGVEEGAFYKYELRTRSGAIRVKTDPFAFAMEHPPGTASRVFSSRHVWKDDDWQRARALREPATEPLSIYELHLGSWQRGPNGRYLDYEALADRLIPHALELGFTHLELLPLTEHPFDGSWGYQVSGYFAPTARFGPPDGLRTFIDRCHQAGLGVILDWVPAHFPRDDFALRRFDGEPLYEYADPRIGEHPDWGTLVFDYGRNEVRNFLITSALFWLESYHFDGLRVDAVASMLYRDYGRKAGEWIPNVHGGRENLEAVRFLRELNEVVHDECHGCITIAEESTAWPGVTRPASHGGLGFTFKWNLGWMHDTLLYFARNPVHRRHHQNQLSFASLYEHTERFLMPLSHDEVVHGKGSLLGRMPGDDWQRFANLRCLLAYQFTRPGKKLLFMGSELAPETEWNADASLDWSLGREPLRAGFRGFLAALGALYGAHPCLWRADASPDGFRWIDCADHEQSVFAFLRRFYDDELAVVMNLTPVPRHDYRVGVPHAGRWFTRLNSDDPVFGGSGHPHVGGGDTEPLPAHGFAQSLRLVLPPLAVLVIERETA